jgi:cell division protein ZipA
MSELRWIILGVGLILIAAVYFFSRRKNVTGYADADDSRKGGAHTEPYLGGFESEPVISGFEGEGETRPNARTTTPANGETGAETPWAGTASPRQSKLILTLHVKARTSAGLAAADIAEALDNAGFHFGRYGIYHYRGSDGDDWFSAANLVEPGRFPDPGSDETAPGITLFMMMPGLAAPRAALDALLAAARRLAVDLDAELTDERRHPLTAGAAQRMREQVARFAAGERG